MEGKDYEFEEEKHLERGVDVNYTSERRAKLSGPSGIAGLLRQPRLLKLTLITTLGAVSRSHPLDTDYCHLEAYDMI